MYLLGFSLDNLSLMALTIADRLRRRRRDRRAGEHLAAHRGRACRRCEAALLGAREVGFTVLSMSLSLIAVFIPILLMGGIVGRLFREFAITLSVAILISLVVSLTTTPMMCAYLLRPHGANAAAASTGPASAPSTPAAAYDRRCGWALRHRGSRSC